MLDSNEGKNDGIGGGEHYRLDPKTSSSKLLGWLVLGIAVGGLIAALVK